MRITPAASIALAILVATAASGCGGSDDQTGDQTVEPADDQTEQPTDDQTDEPTDERTEEPAEREDPPADAPTTAFDADDICSNLSTDDVASILDTEVSDAMDGVATCFYFLPDGMFGVAVVPIDQVNSPSPESVCETAAGVYSDVETATVAGFPAFAGVDAGSVDDTFVVCPPGYQLVFSGAPTRDLLAELATAFLS